MIEDCNKRSAIPFREMQIAQRVLLPVGQVKRALVIQIIGRFIPLRSMFFLV